MVRHSVAVPPPAVGRLQRALAAALYRQGLRSGAPLGRGGGGGAAAPAASRLFSAAAPAEAPAPLWRDPERPEEPPSAFLLFDREVRRTLPAWESGERWRAMTDEQKAPYVDRWRAMTSAEQMKERHNAQMSLYRSSGKEAAGQAEVGGEAPSGVAAPEPEGGRAATPAPPKTAFMLFDEDLRRTLGKMEKSKASEMAANHWWAFSDDEREPYYRRADAMRAEYEQRVGELGDPPAESSGGRAAGGARSADASGPYHSTSPVKQQKRSMSDKASPEVAPGGVASSDIAMKAKYLEHLEGAKKTLDAKMKAEYLEHLQGGEKVDETAAQKSASHFTSRISSAFSRLAAMFPMSLAKRQQQQERSVFTQAGSDEQKRSRHTWADGDEKKPPGKSGDAATEFANAAMKSKYMEHLQGKKHVAMRAAYLEHLKGVKKEVESVPASEPATDFTSRVKSAFSFLASFFEDKPVTAADLATWHPERPRELPSTAFDLFVDLTSLENPKLTKWEARSYAETKWEMLDEKTKEDYGKQVDRLQAVPELSMEASKESAKSAASEAKR